MSQLSVEPVEEPREPAPQGGRGIRRVLSPVRSARGIARILLWAGAAISVLFVVLAVFAPWIAPYRFDQYSAGGHPFPKQGAPDATHLFGTTVQSLDVASRVVFGARTALEVVVQSVVISLLVGVPLGLVSGYLGGWLDRSLVLVMDALFAFPSLLLAIVLSFLLSGLIGGTVTAAALSITVVYIPQYFRVVRNTTVSAKEATYVEAARAIGARPITVMRRYLFTNVVQSVPVIGTLNAADAILTLAALGFLGYGVQPTQAAEWGYDLQRAVADAGAGIWWTGLYPGLAIVLLVTGLTLAGEGLNETLNPTLRTRPLRRVLLPPLPATLAPRTHRDRP
ncbi:ABC transporter permease [Actinocatenispora rupis]|uniref:Putative oligopeptide ABC transporter, permease protein n=1 Tax=Actinocatenispora rupis TaxID=519421 RepID=A0A8J3JBH2_9ACTN|nr:ABC transporter permease [Actinocatenispora rupis]GID15377.1 putative oligopeptide ABC transporter, permease protein [Actinocatenispora rupis]